MDDDYKAVMPEVDIGDNGMPLSKKSTVTEIAGDGKPKSLTTSRSSTDGGASSSASSDELAHIGTTWSQTGDIWWTPATDEHHVYEYDEYYDHDEHYHDRYDDDDDDDGGYDQDEEDGAFFIFVY